MSGLDVERRLTEVLHRHAEDAMNQTDTQAELREFLTRDNDESPRGPERTRRAAVLGAGLAAAAVAAAVFWGSGLTEDRTEPAPVVEPAADPVQVAEEYVAAYAAYDTEKVMAMVAEQADRAGLRLSMARDEAWGVRFLMEPCVEGSTMSSGTLVSCPFALHVLGSQDVGRGPFENALFTVMVAEDGEVLDANPAWNYETNEMGDHVGAVHDWVLKAHPGHREFLELEEQDVPAAQLDRWLGLWQQYTQDYVEAHS